MPSPQSSDPVGIQDSPTDLLVGWARGELQRRRGNPSASLDSGLSDVLRMLSREVVETLLGLNTPDKYALVSKDRLLAMGPLGWLDVAHVSEYARRLADWNAERLDAPLAVLDMQPWEPNIDSDAWADSRLKRWDTDLDRQAPGARMADVHPHLASEAGAPVQPFHTLVVNVCSGLHHTAIILDSSLTHPLVYGPMGDTERLEPVHHEVLKALKLFVQKSQNKLHANILYASRREPVFMKVAAGAVQQDGHTCAWRVLSLYRWLLCVPESTEERRAALEGGFSVSKGWREVWDQFLQAEAALCGCYPKPVGFGIAVPNLLRVRGADGGLTPKAAERLAKVPPLPPSLGAAIPLFLLSCNAASLSSSACCRWKDGSTDNQGPQTRAPTTTWRSHRLAQVRAKARPAPRARARARARPTLRASTMGNRRRKGCGWHAGVPSMLLVGSSFRAQRTAKGKNPKPCAPRASGSTIRWLRGFVEQERRRWKMVRGRMTSRWELGSASKVRALDLHDMA